jgi:2-polyprenyl-6-methoxyphenol hydroxylase-like FAD-dependent oxidoreductase
MLGYLLARAGVEVEVFEKWPDFFRDFRGDTVHPSTLALLKELGLLDDFLALPHNETKEIAVDIASEELPVADFTHLRGVPPFIAFVPQWDFLNFMAEKGKRYPGFHLRMETEVLDLVREGGRVVGARVRNKDEEYVVRAPLVVAADGRHSTVREKAGLTPLDRGAPIDVLWFRIPRADDGTHRSLGSVAAGRVLVLIDRDSYWQCAYIIRKGDFERVKAGGIEAFRASVAATAPRLADAAQALQSFDDVKLLSVSVEHLARWFAPGVLCIGDAAHAMSPVGGVGINLAVQDAVAAANVLAEACARPGGVRDADLARIQKRRAWPASVIQKAQVYIHERILLPALSATEAVRVPWQLKLFKRIPYLRRIPARVIGVGVRPEHVSPRILRERTGQR